MPNAPDVRRFSSADELYPALASALATLGRDRVRATGAFHVALPGGSTPLPLFQLMPQVPFREVMPWERGEFYFSDERGVPASDPASNFGNAQQEMFRHVPTAEIQVHNMVTATDDFVQQAADYAALLKRIAPQRNGLPCLDLVMLGIGSDGHVASLFPQGTAINERDALVIAEDIPGTGWRLSLSLPVINNARQVWIVALGETKREAVTHCLQSATPQLPAQQVTATEQLVWWLDDAAAGTPSPAPA